MPNTISARTDSSNTPLADHRPLRLDPDHPRRRVEGLQPETAHHAVRRPLPPRRLLSLLADPVSSRAFTASSPLWPKLEPLYFTPCTVVLPLCTPATHPSQCTSKPILSNALLPWHFPFFSSERPQRSEKKGNNKELPSAPLAAAALRAPHPPPLPQPPPLLLLAREFPESLVRALVRRRPTSLLDPLERFQDCPDGWNC